LVPGAYLYYSKSSDTIIYMHGVYHFCKLLVNSGPKNNIDIIIIIFFILIINKYFFLVQMQFCNTLNLPENTKAKSLKLVVLVQEIQMSLLLPYLDFDISIKIIFLFVNNIHLKNEQYNFY